MTGQHVCHRSSRQLGSGVVEKRGMGSDKEFQDVLVVVILHRLCKYKFPL